MAKLLFHFAIYDALSQFCGLAVRKVLSFCRLSSMHSVCLLIECDCNLLPDSHLDTNQGVNKTELPHFNISHAVMVRIY